MHFIGIDWADDHHDICVLAADGQIISHFVITDDLPGFEQLERLLRTLDDCHLNIERPNGLLVEWLLAKGYRVSFIPPQILAKMRPRHSKSDPYDAYLIANLLRTGNEECRLITTSSDLVEELSQLVRAHDHLQQERRRISNQIRYVLKAYYPVVIAMFRHVDQPLTLRFLEQYPSPEMARAASLDDLWQFFTAQNYRYKERIPLHFDKLQAPAPSARGVEGYVRHIQALVTVMDILDQQHRGLRKDIRQTFRQHPDAQWWMAFPGVGWLNGARLLARMGDNRQRFPSPEILRAVAGTVPVTRRSGKRISVHFRQACSKPLRKAMTDMARNSVKYSGWAKSYYEGQLARGHDKPRAQRALANRWAGIIWKLWQTGAVYDEMVHLRNRSQRGQLERVS